MKKIIIDTDLCFDCDDALALAIANIAKNKQYIELLAITHCLSDKDCVDVIYQINEYYGNKDIALGVSKNSKTKCEEGKEYFINRMEKRRCESTSSTELILDKLSENEGCTLVFIGLQNNLAYILKHKEDFYKGRKIQDIIQKSVEQIVIMGGDFCGSEAEFNIMQDIESAKIVSEQVDLPLVFVDFKQGCSVYTGEEVQKDKNNPVAKIYRLFSQISGEELRPSWDPITVYFAIFGECACCSLSKKGKVTVLDNGQTIFTEGKGNHRLLTVNTPKEMETAIEKLFE